MKQRLSVAVVALLAISASLSACKKHAADAPATPVADAPAAAASTPPPAAEPAHEPTAEERAAAEKQAKIDLALANQKIIDDPAGQWAVSATASSNYSTIIKNDRHEWEAVSATGAPDAEGRGSPEKGWSPEQANAGIEWLQLEFATPVSASALRVRQISGAGAIIKAELIDETGARHTVWEGSDNAPYVRNEINWFERSFEPTPYKAKGVRLTLATNAINDRPSIDAVQLVGH